MALLSSKTMSIKHHCVNTSLKSSSLPKDICIVALMKRLDFKEDKE